MQLPASLAAQAWRWMANFGKFLVLCLRQPQPYRCNIFFQMRNRGRSGDRQNHLGPLEASASFASRKNPLDCWM
jgi:hypothetical protein